MESMKCARIMFLVLVSLGLVWTAAAVDQLISLQGKVTSGGTPVDDGDLVVTIYNSNTSGTMVFNSTTNFNNAIQDGYFDVMLGSITTLDLNYNQYYYMDIKINGQDIDWQNGADERLQFESLSGDTVSGTIKMAGGQLQVCSSTDTSKCLTIFQNSTYTNISTNVGDIEIDPFGSKKENNTVTIHGKLKVTDDVDIGENSLIINASTYSIYRRNSPVSAPNESGITFLDNGTVKIGPNDGRTIIAGTLQIGNASMVIDGSQGKIFSRQAPTSGISFGSTGTIEATGLMDMQQGMYDRRFTNPAGGSAKLINGSIWIGGYTNCYLYNANPSVCNSVSGCTYNSQGNYCYESGNNRIYLSDQTYKNSNGIVFVASVKQTGWNRVGLITCANANPPTSAYNFFVKGNRFWVYEIASGNEYARTSADGYTMPVNVTGSVHKLKVFVPPGGEDVARFYVDGNLVFTLKTSTNFYMSGTSYYVTTTLRDGKFGMIVQGPDPQGFQDVDITDGTAEAFTQMSGAMMKGLEFFIDKQEQYLNWTSGNIIIGGYEHYVNAGSIPLSSLSGTYGRYIYVHVNNLYGYENGLSVQYNWGVYGSEDLRQDPHNIILGYAFGGKIWTQGSYVGSIKGDLQVEGKIYSQGVEVGGSGTNSDYVNKSGDTMTGALTVPSVITPFIKPSADSATAFQFRKADGTTSVFNVDTTNSMIGIGTTGPTEKLHIYDSRTTAGSAGFYVQKPGTVVGTSYGSYISTTGGSTTNVGGYFSASGATNNYGLIVGAGNVGIGTTSPGTKLDIKSGAVSTDVLRVLSSDGGSIFEVSETSDTGGFVGIKDASAVRQVLLHTSGNSYLNGGNVGIGTTAPAEKLHVVGDVRIDGNLKILKNISNINVQTLVVNGTIRPPAGLGGTFDLGDDSLTWRNGYFSGNVEMANLYDVDGTNFFDGSCTYGVASIDATGALSCAAQQGAGSVTGTGVANRLALWTSGTNINTTESLVWDASNKRLGIGGTSPSAKLQVNGKLNMANYTIYAAGLNGGNVNATLLNSNTISEVFSNLTTAMGYNPSGTYLPLAGGTMTGAINFNGKVATNAGITGGNVNATLLNSNTISELFSNVTAARTHTNTVMTELGNLTNAQTWTKLQTVNELSIGNLNMTGVADSGMNLNGHVLSNAGITGGNLNGTLLNSNTISELFSNVTAAMGYNPSGTYLPLAGGTMTGVINFNGKVATNAGISGGNLNVSSYAAIGAAPVSGFALVVGGDTRINGNLQILKNISNVNVQTLVVNGTIRPPKSLGGTFDIGDDTLNWRNGYFSGNVEMANLYDVDGTNFFDGTCAYGVASIDATGALTCASSQGTVTSAATANYIPKMSSGTALANSVIYETGGNIGIGTTGPSKLLTVAGTNTAGIVRILNNNPAGNILAGDVVGELQFDGIDSNAQGSTVDAMGLIRVIAGVNILDTNMVSDMAFLVKTGSVDYNQAATEVMRITNGGNVGIGGTSPSAKLQVNGNLNMANNSIYAVTNLNGNTLSELFSNVTAAMGYNPSGAYLPLAGGTMTGAINFNGKVATNAGITGGNVNATLLNGNTISEIFSNLTTTGYWARASGNLYPNTISDNVGIGTTAPASKLEIHGNVSLQGTTLSAINGSLKIGTGTARPNIDFGSGTNADLFVADDLQTKGSIYGAHSDLAEIITSATGAELEPGDVVVIDTESDGVKLSSEKYQTTVAGVISTKPGMLLGSDNEGVALALTGQVPMKVTSENGSIKRGDLLTTSSVPGHAMKCENRNRCSGAIVGKALENFDGKEGKINVLVTLA